MDFGNQRWVLAQRKLVWGLQPPVSGTQSALLCQWLVSISLDFSEAFFLEASSQTIALEYGLISSGWKCSLGAPAGQRNSQQQQSRKMKTCYVQAHSNWALMKHYVSLSRSPKEIFVVNVETPLVTCGRTMEEDEGHFRKNITDSELKKKVRTRNVLHRGTNPPHGAVSACCPQKTRSDGALYAIFSSINNSNWNIIYIRKDSLSRERPLLQSVADLQVKNETCITFFKKKARQRRWNLERRVTPVHRWNQFSLITSERLIQDTFHKEIQAWKFRSLIKKKSSFQYH